VELKKAWHDPVWSKIIATAIIAFAAAAWAAYKNWWPAIWQGIVNGNATAWNYLLATTPVRHWLLGVLILVAVLFVILLISVAASLLPRTDPYGKLVSFAADWHSYTSDDFFNLKWRWLYQGGEIVLNAYCPKCDYQVYPDDMSDFPNHINFYCDFCKRRIVTQNESWGSMKGKVIRFIQQKIRTGTYPRAGERFTSHTAS
jgi:hypothetical protein